MRTVEITSGQNGFQVWQAVFREQVELNLSSEAWRNIRDAHEALGRVVAQGGPLYGINTGSGRLAGTIIPENDILALQRNLVLSHAIGSGPPLSDAETRLVLAMKIGCFAQGRSGVRPSLVETMVRMFNSGILPVMPSQGSVGASGDLTPLAHLAGAMMGEGQVSFAGRIVPAGDALAEVGLEPAVLQPKEGMSLLNGTQVSTALALSAAFETRQALDSAVLIGALKTEAV